MHMHRLLLKAMGMHTRRVPRYSTMLLSRRPLYQIKITSVEVVVLFVLLPVRWPHDGAATIVVLQ